MAGRHGTSIGAKTMRKFFYSLYATFAAIVFIIGATVVGLLMMARDWIQGKDK